jgi:hypothetical protein
MKQRASFSREQRSQYLEEYRQSGLTITAFAKQHEGLSRSLVSAWLRRYVRRAPQAVLAGQALKAVPLQEISLSQVFGQPAWAAELVLPGGLTVRLGANALEQLLPELHNRLRQ